ncbi:hypothetical protein FRX31_013214 [Thalictrum thalictroides]|uniref:Transmembrane protein n=1 Tax=Thalictrum thalictroides TaxID=46969 RepID=A0A7J6WIJ9_THATH|nr:hypothetical protein FRX31_013214 [Thalictrum thalictroides]
MASTFSLAPTFFFFVNFTTILIIFMAFQVSAARTTLVITPSILKHGAEFENAGNVVYQPAVSNFLAKGLHYPPSGPSHRGHNIPNFMKHVHITSSPFKKKMRGLQVAESVPSPGAGH